MNQKPRVMYCPNCKKNNRLDMSPQKRTPAAYLYSYVNREENECPYCHCRLLPMNIDVFEYNTILDISGDPEFTQAMDDLKQKDPIEFQLKMSQFKTQLQQQESSKQTNTTPTKDVIRCPKCNSTAITTGARGVNNFWGLLGASKTVNRCGNCGYTWKPNNW